MSEQEKKLQRIYDMLDAETKQKFLCLPYTKKKEKFLDNIRVEGWTKTRRRLFNYSFFGD